MGVGQAGRRLRSSRFLPRSVFNRYAEGTDRLNTLNLLRVCAPRQVVKATAATPRVQPLHKPVRIYRMALHAPVRVHQQANSPAGEKFPERLSTRLWEFTSEVFRPPVRVLSKGGGADQGAPGRETRVALPVVTRDYERLPVS